MSQPTVKFGLDAIQYQYLLKTLVVPLNRIGATVWCFGSRARRDHSKFSDIDLLVESVKNLDLEIGQIQEIIEESNFPFKVDIVQERNLANAYRDSVIREKVLFTP